jgi:hypothetical protein
MIYEFICDCGETQALDLPAFSAPNHPFCVKGCRGIMRRIFGASIDTTGCKDHSYIPEKDRVYDPHRTVSAEKQERLFHERIKEKRKQHRDGGNRGSFRHSHSIPADLHHGKIRETGDKNYWDDPKNMSRHSDCRVDK